MSDLSRLRQLLSDYFSESELQTLVFDLGLDYEMLPGPTKGDKARELITQLRRRGRLTELVEAGRQLRPNLEWPYPSDAAEAPPARAREWTPGAKPQPATLDPFTYGNPISDPTRFFGRRREVEQVFNRLRNAEAESSSLVGGRRIGKSSLLNYLAHTDVRHRYGMDTEHYIFVYVDLQMVDSQTTPRRLWKRLLSQMERQCADEGLTTKVREIIAEDVFDNFSLADLFDTVDLLNKNVIFLLDEFENVTANPNFDPSFFYGLRSLAIQHNLSLITSSRHELIELTHSQAVRSSPFFNIFANITVRLFGDDEARHMITTLLANTAITFSDEEIATLSEIAGGQPFFLQAAGHFLFAAYGSYADAARRRGAWLKAFGDEVAPHMAHYWNAAAPQEQVTLLILALLSRQAGGGRPQFALSPLESLYPRASQSLNWLARLSYVAEGPGQYGLFSSAFGEWVLSEVKSGNRAPVDPAVVARDQEIMARLPADHRRALEPVLPSIGRSYHHLILTWVERTNDVDAATRLLREGLAR